MSRQSKSPYRNSDYYYEQINSVIKESFNSEQEKEIKKVMHRAIKIPSKKIINLEVTFWFIKDFYCVIYLGNDCRKKNKIYDEKTLKYVLELTIHWLISLTLWSATLIVFIAVIYYAKSVMGIDVFPEQHLRDFMY